jgi:hypothetical protein
VAAARVGALRGGGYRGNQSADPFADLALFERPRPLTQVRWPRPRAQEVGKRIGAL